MTTYGHKIVNKEVEKEYWDRWSELMSQRNREANKRDIDTYSNKFVLDNNEWISLFEYNFEHIN